MKMAEKRKRRSVAYKLPTHRRCRNLSEGKHRRVAGKSSTKTRVAPSFKTPLSRLGIVPAENGNVSGKPIDNAKRVAALIMRNNKAREDKYRNLYSPAMVKKTRILPFLGYGLYATAFKRRERCNILCNRRMKACKKK